MFDPQNPTAQVATGATVFDAAGEKVGTVAESNQQRRYLLVQKGWLFHKDFYVPSNAVTRIDELGGVYLNLYKQDLGEGYDNPPVGDTTTATGTSSTDAARSSANMSAAPGTTSGTTQGTAATPGATTGAASSGDEMRIPVREEELVAGTRTEQEGTVHIHKDVVEEQQTVEVPLQRDEVTVERVPLKGEVDPGTLDDTAFTKRDIDVPVMGEEPVVGKRVRAVEEVDVRKGTVTDSKQVSDTVRKERVSVEGAENVDRTDQQDPGTRTDAATPNNP
ncbi:MAG: hypothetical protein JWO42_3428 [Chloroflexi bacterium]|nr:hypothetical protein [Chloroflexota bacterium]